MNDDRNNLNLEVVSLILPYNSYIPIDDSGVLQRTNARAFVEGI
jgi:hypothetical protein